MSKTYKVVSTLVIIAVVVVGGYYLYQQHRARKAGMLTENITHDGDAWTADFTARIGAPEQRVFDTIKDVEHAKSDAGEERAGDIANRQREDRRDADRRAGRAGHHDPTRLRVFSRPSIASSITPSAADRSRPPRNIISMTRALPR